MARIHLPPDIGSDVFDTKARVDRLERRHSTPTNIQFSGKAITFQGVARLDDDHIADGGFEWQWDGTNGALFDGPEIRPLVAPALYLAIANLYVEGLSGLVDPGVSPIALQFGSGDETTQWGQGQIVVVEGEGDTGGDSISYLLPWRGGSQAPLSIAGPFIPGFGLVWTITVTGVSLSG